MALSIEQCQELVLEFCSIYPIAAQIAYKIRNTQEELYGQENTKDKVGAILGGFHPQQRQADFAASNFRDKDEFKATLRHEVLGHFGINTFTAGEKAQVLKAIVEARDQPVLRGLWRKIDKWYADQPEHKRAEEVFAFTCEAVLPDRPVDPIQAEKSYREVCVERTRPMTERDLTNITAMVAQGMRDRTRAPQEHPREDYEMRRGDNMEDGKKPFHETVAEKLIDQLKQGTAPWQKPWEPGEAGANMPINPTTGKRYKGINALQLMSEGREDQRWMTYKQAAAADAQVRKGEKGTPIQYWKFTEEQTKIDAAGRPVFDDFGEPIKQTVQLERPKVFFATVFNAEQIDGLPPREPRKEQSWNAVERAEQILQASGAVIRNSEQDRAFYRPSTDSIHLPGKDHFATADNYYATALHELGHWTGHQSRLDRDLVHPFGSEGYAKEELRAEIASMILGDELGIGHDPQQHAAYVGSWIKALQSDPLEIFRAAAEAEKIQTYVLGLEQKQIQVQAPSQAQSAADRVQDQKFGDAWRIRDQLNTELEPHGLAVDFEASEALGGLNLYRMNGKVMEPVMISTTLGDTVKSFPWESTTEQILAWFQQEQENSQVSKVADFVSQNHDIVRDTIAAASSNVGPDLAAIFADVAKMSRISEALAEMFQEKNLGYIKETITVLVSAVTHFVKEAINGGAASLVQAADQPAADTGTSDHMDPATVQRDAQMVADFISANHNLITEKIIENTRTADPMLKAILADDEKMQSIRGKVSEKLEGLNPVYVAEAQAVIASAVGRKDAQEVALEARQLRSVSEEALSAEQEQRDIQKVVNFLEANRNLFSEKVAENTRNAAPDLKAILSDTVKMDRLEKPVQAELNGTNPTYIKETLAVIAATLDRPDAQRTASVAAAARADLDQQVKEHLVDTEQDLLDAKKVAAFIAANHNLYAKKVAENTRFADPALKTLLSDDVRMKALEDHINEHLDGLNPAVISEVRDVIAYTLKNEQANVAESKQAEQAEILAELRQLSEKSEVGYDPLKSWENLKAEAERNGYKAEISHGGARWYEKAFAVTYLDKNDVDSGIVTMLNEDGKAITNVGENRVPGTRLTSDLEWQSEALGAAFAKIRDQALMKERDMQSAQQQEFIPADPKTIERAEAWTLARLEQGKLARALDSASVVQMDRIQDVLSDMQPLNTQNPFWRRHPLPQDVGPLQDKVDAAYVMVEMRQVDALIAAAFIDHRTGHDFDGGATLNRKVERVFAFTLPNDWNGHVQVQGNITEQIDGKAVETSALSKGVAPESWGVYAQHNDGSYKLLATHSSEQEADALAERLALIDVKATTNEFEKAVKLARINEERVRRDPNSTEEDILAAKEVRKFAEVTATLNDDDLHRRIEVEKRERSAPVAAPSTGADERPKAEKVFIEVPFKEKEEAKALGAKWDRNQLSWYVPSNLDPAPFVKWTQEAVQTPPEAAQTPAAAVVKAAATAVSEGRIYLAVPYNERTEAKEAGAEWDKAAKSWYAGPKADLVKLEKWKPENVSAQQEPAMTPREEFVLALKSIGCVIPSGSDHPIMDGTKHRISVEGEKFTEKSGSGFYVGHLDGHPAGYMMNNRTGVDLKWKSKGYTLDPEQKALLAAEAAEKLQQRDAELAKQQEQAAKRVSKELGKLLPVTTATSYMQAKGIVPHAGALTDKDGKKTYLPATDVHGKQWTTQYIKEDGTKRFAKDSRKEGCFHVVGGLDELAKAPAIVIGEGYATAAQLKQSLGFATVSAFDSGNLAVVAQALHQKFPDKPIVIAGDDDRHLEVTQGANPGRNKAVEAANLVGGKLMMPIFAPGENNYPANLPPVTPDLYREHQRTGKVLSGEQMAALAQMKQFTDFNDLANKSALGLEGIDRQVKSLVESVIEKHQASQSEQQQQEQDRGATIDPEKVQKEQVEAPKRRKAVKIA